MASSSKYINMPVLFACGIGSVILLVASFVTAMAWNGQMRQNIRAEKFESAPQGTVHNNAVMAEQTPAIEDVQAAFDAIRE